MDGAPIAPTPMGYWSRCGHGSCTTIPGAEAASYRVQTADIGFKIHATVTANSSPDASMRQW